MPLSPARPVISYCLLILSVVLVAACDDSDPPATDVPSELAELDEHEQLPDTDSLDEHDSELPELDGDSTDSADIEASDQSDEEQSQPPPASGCPALPPASGTIIAVEPSQTAQLRGIVAAAAEGSTILFADGHYHLGGEYIWIDIPGLTLRSASGNREAVILDGDYETTEIITIAASNVTIADLSLRRAYTHPIHVTTAGSDVVNTLIYNVAITDPREQAIKINPGSGGFPDAGEIACSHLSLSDEGRPQVNPTSGGCYTGGVDAHQARGWVIRDNQIEGFWCPNGLSEHAIHLWRGCRDTLVMRNVLRDNARGIGFGLASSGEARSYVDAPCPTATGSYVDHYGGIIRNNVVFASRPELFASGSGFDCGICLWSACEAQVLHNSVVSTGPNFSSIEWRFSGASGNVVANNLVSHPLRERDGASATQLGNLGEAALSLFVDGAGGDLHLADGASAIDQGVVLEPGLCDDDVDGEARLDGAPDVGADER
ncbi:MAG: hypothetical protein RBU37_08825 [Myxococcota bacterium]|jgi:hypothetical protein|nr:hypothetical protein [Myxococcota bacterium]